MCVSGRGGGGYIHIFVFCLNVFYSISQPNFEIMLVLKGWLHGFVHEHQKLIYYENCPKDKPEPVFHFMAIFLRADKQKANAISW